MDASCSDGVKNGNETDVDCGGSCKPCGDNLGCNGAVDCTSGVCDTNAKICTPPSCTDSVKNGAEVDVDCGGSTCPACGVGRACTAAMGCASGVCTGAQCQAPSCTDMVKNGAETGVDCGGGTCPGCAAGGNCTRSTDCASQVCGGGGTCAMATCTDTIKNGAETDTDCGGTCGGCADGKMCKIAGDCTSVVCTGGMCVGAQCNDGVKNGKETDIDCGGNTCSPCADGKVCGAASDCTSGVCSGGKCQTPSCSDSVKNGGESDVDCGGTCSGCGPGKLCKQNTDCLSTSCLSGKCVTTPTDFGDGADGAITITSTGTTINTWTQLTTDGNKNDTSISVASGSAFKQGDEILVIQMQAPSGAGNYEFHRVVSVAGNTVGLERGLTQTFVSGGFNQANARAAQAVRVPRFTTVQVNSAQTITAKGWDGFSGGVVAFRASQSVSFNTGASIVTTGQGFRGPPRETGNHQLNGKTGEGVLGNSLTICADQNTVPDTGTGGCGGVEGNYHSFDGVGGAGGGANEATPPKDGFTYSNNSRYLGKDGAPYLQGNFNVLVLGGAGGQGDNGSNDFLSRAAGGNGGGIVFVAAPTISGITVTAGGIQGEQGCDYTGQGGDWGVDGGGGGAGGTVWLRANSISSATLTAVGGAGNNVCGHSGQCMSDSGGAGRIRVDATSYSGTSMPTANRGSPP